MHKQFTFIILTLSLLGLPFLTYAAIYKHVDTNDRVTYSNVKIKGGKKLMIEPADTSFGTNTGRDAESSPASKKATPSNFPKVNKNTQKQRDNSRKQILLSELASEKVALTNAKKAYAEGKAKPEVYRKRNADGSSNTFKNVPKFEAKIKKLQETVDSHQRNLDFLQKEIANIQ